MEAVEMKEENYYGAVFVSEETLIQVSENQLDTGNIEPPPFLIICNDNTNTKHWYKIYVDQTGRFGDGQIGLTSFQMDFLGEDAFDKMDGKLYVRIKLFPTERIPQASKIHFTVDYLAEKTEEETETEMHGGESAFVVDTDHLALYVRECFHGKPLQAGHCAVAMNFMKQKSDDGEEIYVKGNVELCVKEIELCVKGTDKHVGKIDSNTTRITFERSRRDVSLTGNYGSVERRLNAYFHHGIHCFNNEFVSLMDRMGHYVKKGTSSRNESDCYGLL